MESSYFYDYDPMGFPRDTQHFFNILVICVAIPPENAGELLPEGVTDIWYLNELTEPRPRAFHFYVDDDFHSYPDDEFDEDYYDDIDYQIEFFPHSVVEIYNRNEVCFYSMLDFDTDDLWEIDGNDIEEY